MKPIILPLLAAAGIAALISTKPAPLTGKWEKHQLSRYFWAEDACVADIDSDGHADILSGLCWYAGPDFKTTHTIHPDTLTFEPAAKKSPAENPGEDGTPWKRHTALASTDNESPMLADINGDKQQ